MLMISIILMVVLPYLVWQNLSSGPSKWVFISQDGQAALLGSHNEFATDGNWTFIDSRSLGFYSTLPDRTNPIKKALEYYRIFPSRFIPSLFCKLRDSLMRPASVSLLIYASILYLFFYLFKRFSKRVFLLIGFFTFCA